MNFRIVTLSIYFIALFAAMPVAAKVDLNKYHEEIVDFSIDDNLQTPQVPSKLLAQAQNEMLKLKNRFDTSGLTTDLTERDGLVLMVTVPCSDLFIPNDTMLASFADTKLKHFVAPMRTPDRYKMLIIVHSDDTGSDDYLNNLTRARADAVRQWFADEGLEVEGIVPYGLGYDEPLNTESSRKARAANRRVEFYFVPGPIMIEALRIKK